MAHAATEGCLRWVQRAQEALALGQQGTLTFQVAAAPPSALMWSTERPTAVQVDMYMADTALLAIHPTVVAPTAGLEAEEAQG